VSNLTAAFKSNSTTFWAKAASFEDTLSLFGAFLVTESFYPLACAVESAVAQPDFNAVASVADNTVTENPYVKLVGWFPYAEATLDSTFTVAALALASHDDAVVTVAFAAFVVKTVAQSFIYTSNSDLLAFTQKLSPPGPFSIPYLSN